MRGGGDLWGGSGELWGEGGYRGILGSSGGHFPLYNTSAINISQACVDIPASGHSHSPIKHSEEPSELVYSVGGKKHFPTLHTGIKNSHGKITVRKNCSLFLDLLQYCSFVHFLGSLFVNNFLLQCSANSRLGYMTDPTKPTAEKERETERQKNENDVQDTEKRLEMEE